jgi:gamma-glutamyl:cysteine ligase YbdK (ATP-grasp superfamily)
MSQLAVPDPVTLADRFGARGVAGRRRLRCDSPPPHRGAALDERSVYFLARLSPRYPTVEIRVAGVCLDVDTAVLLAGLTRALVATALAEARQGMPVAAAPARWVAAALVTAARQGLSGTGVDPFAGQVIATRNLRSASLSMSTQRSAPVATPGASPSC